MERCSPPPMARTEVSAAASPSSDLSASTTLAPSSANRSAVRRPMPEAAPVINAIFFESDPMEISENQGARFESGCAAVALGQGEHVREAWIAARQDSVRAITNRGVETSSRELVEAVVSHGLECLLSNRVR